MQPPIKFVLSGKLPHSAAEASMQEDRDRFYVSADNQFDLEAIKAAIPIVAARIEAQKTVRLALYILAAVFAIVAAIIIVVAPNGREVATEIVTVSLCVLAAGCAGYGTFGLRTPIASLEAKASEVISKTSRSKNSN